MHGPVVTEFKCDDNFAFYSSGVMVQPGQPEKHSSLVQEEEGIVVPSQGDIPLP